MSDTQHRRRSASRSVKERIGKRRSAETGESSVAGAGPGARAQLSALGERIRSLRAQRGMTRKGVARRADISERYLANLEYGTANPSILLLQQVAIALDCSLAELTGDVTTSSPEWLLIREMLKESDEATLRRVRSKIGEILGNAGASPTRGALVALIGLRGAGKSTLGRMLADDLGFPFVELSREIERHAGCSAAEIQALYGMGAYRRYERRALEEVTEGLDAAVIAIPGGLVSEAATFRLLLARCTTVWLKAAPEDHMNRVVEQGDLRPMAGNAEAMDDLKRILDSRRPFYSKADLAVDTSAQSLTATFARLRVLVREALDLSSPASGRVKARG
jgi:XRE family aerobic/anaerobic benzoate catabolism transcriptional regulator